MRTLREKQRPVPEVRAVQDSGGVAEHRTDAGAALLGPYFCFLGLCSNMGGEGMKMGIKITLGWHIAATSPLLSY